MYVVEICDKLNAHCLGVEFIGVHAVFLRRSISSLTFSFSKAISWIDPRISTMSNRLVAFSFTITISP